MKKKTKVICEKSVTLLAAAAMTAVLAGSPAYTVAGSQASRIEMSSLIPENVTIDEPTALSDIELPKCDYGTLSWVDGSYVPSSRVESCEVLFKPDKSVDLSYLPGWDEEAQAVRGTITVVVSSLESSAPYDSSQEEDAWEDDTFAEEGGSREEEPDADNASGKDDSFQDGSAKESEAADKDGGAQDVSGEGSKAPEENADSTSGGFGEEAGTPGEDGSTQEVTPGENMPAEESQGEGSDEGVSLGEAAEEDSLTDAISQTEEENPLGTPGTLADAVSAVEKVEAYEDGQGDSQEQDNVLLNALTAAWIAENVKEEGGEASETEEGAESQTEDTQEGQSVSGEAPEEEVLEGQPVTGDVLEEDALEEQSVTSEAPEEEVTEGQPVSGEAPEEDTQEEQPAAGEVVKETPAAVMPGATILDLDEETVQDVTPEEAEEEPAEEDGDNIFDTPLDFSAEDPRPVTAEEDLSEEEQAARASENHTCDGISVSGVNLPWYVQFRVASGESYEFTNEQDAMIFQSYEFELWDLKNNTEYEIPDGEYISVTVPVKAGYTYTIEHLLDNGAKETIVPSVDGSTMIFSTHSLSPFGIAGFKPLVGGDIIEDGYSGTGTPTPTPTLTITPAGTLTPSPSATGTSSQTNGGSTGNTGGTAGTGTGSGSTGTANSGTVGGNIGTSNSGTADGNAGTSNSGANGNTGASNSGTSGGSGNAGTSGGTAVSGSGSGTQGNVSGTAGGADTGSQGTSSKAVQTGDNTAVFPFAALAAVSGAVMAAAAKLRKKRI